MCLKSYLGIIFIKAFAECFLLALVKHFAKLNHLWNFAYLPIVFAPLVTHKKPIFVIMMSVPVKWYYLNFWSNCMKSKYMRGRTIRRFLDLTKMRHIRKIDQLISKKKETQNVTSITNITKTLLMPFPKRNRSFSGDHYLLNY